MSYQSLKNKVVLITGGGSGIGKESALLFSEQGAHIVIADINGFAGEETVELIKKQNGSAVYVNVNIAKANDCEHMITVADQEFGGIDVLFNNAGIMHYADGDIVNLEEKVWDTTMSVNLKGVFLSCKYGIPALIKRGAGTIINTSSFVALRGSAMANMAYGASKAAVISLTQDLAARYAREKIRVNALCPGPTLTKSFQSYIDDEIGRKEEYLNLIPMKHFANISEIAKAALFLASDDSSYMTGATLVVDGGITATYSS